jgi:hypothetical protein
MAGIRRSNRPRITPHPLRSQTLDRQRLEHLANIDLLDQAAASKPTQ